MIVSVRQDADLAPEDAAAVPASSDVVVVGAGTMGAWTALFAQTGTPDGDAGGGRTVLLIDAFGAGSPRATSGDESRIIRAAHGADPLYARWARRGRRLRGRYAARSGRAPFLPGGGGW